MLRRMKEAVQKQLYNKCYDRYTSEVQRQRERYAAFLQQRGEQSVIKQETLSEPVEQAGGMRIYKGTDCCVFVSDNGVAEPDLTARFDAFMKEHTSCLGAYAHEDYVDAAGRRHHPWFKPDFSPDTLADSFYIGNVFALRRRCCGEEPGEWIERESAITLVLETVCDALAQQKGKALEVLDSILFHQFGEDTVDCDKEGEILTGDNPLTDWMNFHRMPKESFAAEVYRMGVRTAFSGRKLVSVIIPSKDNPKVLHTCIRSLREKTEGIGYEIIVVDNGSTPENRAVLEQMAEEENFCYVYRQMEFNFSVMCNLGAGKARCGMLLFLNDDMEIIQADWMLKLYEKAMLTHAGAVGAKLLYPDSDVIQHAGVTNLVVGPAHKLLKEHDAESFYHGRNRGIHNMLAVTAACMMVGRDKFRQAGGFCEDIAVSYNDVDFCFTLYELGFYNIQRNDVILYHHESLSRGDDNLSEAKWERLLLEKEKLYTRHPQLKGRDPFYSEHLAGHFSDYLCSFEYDYERRDCYTKVKPYRGKEPVQWSNNCLTITIEHARRERRLDRTEEKEVLWIEGWAYILGLDNCRYEKEILLFGENGKNYSAEVLTRYRRDVEEILPQQTHVALSGFTCRILKEKIAPGSYHIAMLAKDCCSREKLYQTTDTVLVVETNDL